MAQVQFEQAKHLEGNYRWKTAAAKYQTAMHLDPFNAEYFAGTGGFLLRQGKYRQNIDRISWLKRAEALHKRACQLNPRYADYRYLLGNVRLELGQTNAAIGDFRKTIEKDPYNFRNNYLIGYDLFGIWDKLDIPEKDFALNRFSYVLKRQPWYDTFVYPVILYYAEDFALAQEVTPQTLTGYKGLYSFISENNLWQYRKQVKKSLDFYRQKEQPEEFKQAQLNKLLNIERLKREGQGADDLIYAEEWQGTTEGASQYENGNMYWNGTIDTAIKLPRGKIAIIIRAKGEQAYGVWPYMVVELEGEEIGEEFVNSAEWKPYAFEVGTDGGIKILSVSFLNDDGDRQEGIDRNLYVGEARIITYVSSQ